LSPAIVADGDGQVGNWSSFEIDVHAVALIGMIGHVDVVAQWACP
jgi:hypothetical protein